jgi:hypothetical protein
MGSLTFVSSQRQENDSAAERRWENEGGNPGQLQPLPCDYRKEDATNASARGTLKAFRYKVNGNSAATVEAAIPVDNPVSKNN